MIQPGFRSAIDAKSEERAFRGEANGSLPYESLLVPMVPKCFERLEHFERSRH
jgi:hypothetical protein